MILILIYKGPRTVRGNDLQPTPVDIVVGENMLQQYSNGASRARSRTSSMGEGSRGILHSLTKSPVVDDLSDTSTHSNTESSTFSTLTSISHVGIYSASSSWESKSEINDVLFHNPQSEGDEYAGDDDIGYEKLSKEVMSMASREKIERMRVFEDDECGSDDSECEDYDFAMPAKAQKNEDGVLFFVNNAAQRRTIPSDDEYSESPEQFEMDMGMCLSNYKKKYANVNIVGKTSLEYFDLKVSLNFLNVD